MTGNFVRRSFEEAGKGLMSYLHDYADRPEVVEMFPPTVAGLEFQREQLVKLDSADQRYSLAHERIQDLRSPDMRCWRLYVIARQCLNALLDEAGLRPPLDMFKAVFGNDSMLKKIATASKLLNMDQSHWDELIEVKRIWSVFAFSASGYINPHEIEPLFNAAVELYLQTAEKLGLKGEIER